MDKELTEILKRLYLFVKKEILLSLEEGKLNKIPYEYLEAKNLDFKFGHTSFSYDFNNIQYFDYYDWSTNYFIEFLETKIEPSDEFEVASEEIRKAFDISVENIKYVKKIGVGGYVKYLMRNIPNGALTDENIDSCIKTFIDDYRTSGGDKIFAWKIQVWLNSFHLETERIQIGNYILRKPKVEELHLSRPRKLHVDEFEQITGRSISATAILEFTQRAPKQIIGIISDEIRYEIESCIDVLRLYKVGNITANSILVSPISVLENDYQERPDSPFDKSWKDKVENQHTSKYEYSLKEDELENFTEFFKKVKPLVNKISPKNYLNGSYLEIAYHRYKDSLLRSEVNVNRLVSAISCLEALLSNTTSEITFKISVHVSALLRHYDFNSIVILNKMKEAYKIRSLILHGDKLKDKLLEFTKHHTHEIVNYARLCLLTSLQLNLSKDQLIETLDKTLVSNEEFLKLNILIKTQVSIPEPYPFRIITNGDEFMNKKIVCIGWGSLIWQPKSFKVIGAWNEDGPELPIEFVRESSGNRITLVIDSESKPKRTLWALMPTTDLLQAIDALKERENSQKIEFINATDETTDNIKKVIVDWLRLKRLDAAIWTALGAKFNEKSIRPSVEQVISYLANLTGDSKKNAEEYVRKAPKQIDTEYRKQIETELGWI